jgi:hypothetical protein
MRLKSTGYSGFTAVILIFHLRAEAKKKNFWFESQAVNKAQAFIITD